MVGGFCWGVFCFSNISLVANISVDGILDSVSIWALITDRSAQGAVSMMKMTNRKYELPSREEIDLARVSAAALTKLLQDLPDKDRANIKMGNEDLIVPRQAIELLRDILAGMSAGKTINIVPMASELTTQQAADFLNVSRPYLIGLLEQGEISFTLVGSHRRIRFDDLLAYREKMVNNSKAAMAELMKLSQELGIGY